MQAPARRPGSAPGREVRPGLGRRGFLSAGGGILVRESRTGASSTTQTFNLPPSWPALYYKAGYPALQAVKARWDPRNVFHHAQSITPAVP